MPFTLLLYSTRKPNTTPTSFKTHYETTHIPLLKSLTGPHFPKSHKRFYIQRNPTNTDDHPSQNDIEYPATVLAGTQSDFPHDAVAELTFEDVAGFETFMGIVGRSEVKEAIERDEERFLDRGEMRAVVVGEVVVTEGDGGA